MEVQGNAPNTLILDVNVTGDADVSAWVAIFIRACRSRNLASGTIEFYVKKLNGFVRFCNSMAVQNVVEITPDLIRSFLIHLDEAGHRPGGVHAYFRSVRTFLRWYEQELDPVDWKNPIHKIKAPMVPLEPLEPVRIDTVRAMLETCTGGDLSATRDRAILLFLLDTGARLAEFLGLNREDVDPITGTVLIRSGKGRKPRTVYLGDKSRQFLRKYLRARTDHNPALWITRSGSRLGQAGLRMLLRRRANRANLAAPSPHDFRRAFALERWRAGVDLLTISKLMGHTSLQVLSRYMKQAGEDLELAARKSSPVDLYF